eukprot:TRINITY_DN12318_c0_g1_i1.p1 TRINITY_DN12318_c0_g1~~TRINITY_DN12318_c0_g1_i1.p1  ORF type:complete len:119 (-),score=46.67 TRINITY_DN12318_c0_g1_i1:314-670(-)
MERKRAWSKICISRDDDDDDSTDSWQEKKQKFLPTLESADKVVLGDGASSVGDGNPHGAEGGDSSAGSERSVSGPNNGDGSDTRVEERRETTEMIKREENSKEQEKRLREKLESMMRK